MKSADKLVLILLDDLDGVVAELRKIYPEAVTSSESVSVGRPQSGIAVRTNRVSDPTGDAAVDPRRQRRVGNVKQARKAVKRSVAAAREALAHAVLAAER